MGDLGKAKKSLSSKVGESADVLGVKVVSSDLERVIEKIDELVSNWTKKPNVRPFFLTTVNVEFVMTAREDREFAEILARCDLPLADGFGLKLADRSIRPVPGRKLVERLVSLGKYRIFYLGGKQGAAKQMSDKFPSAVKTKLPLKPGLKGQNWDEGSEDIRSETASPKLGKKANARILRKISSYKPEILLVAYGAPWQEKWIWRNLNKIKAGVVIGVGGSFDYLTGRAVPPPEVISRLGLEWLWRLVREPWRWRRQLRLLEYVGEVLRSKSSKVGSIIVV